VQEAEGAEREFGGTTCGGDGGTDWRASLDGLRPNSHERRGTRDAHARGHDEVGGAVLLLALVLLVLGAMLVLFLVWNKSTCNRTDGVLRVFVSELGACAGIEEDGGHAREHSNETRRRVSHGGALALPAHSVVNGKCSTDPAANIIKHSGPRGAPPSREVGRADSSPESRNERGVSERTSGHERIHGGKRVRGECGVEEARSGVGEQVDKGPHRVRELMVPQERGEEGARGRMRARRGGKAPPNDCGVERRACVVQALKGVQRAEDGTSNAFAGGAGLGRAVCRECGGSARRFGRDEGAAALVLKVAAPRQQAVPKAQARGPHWRRERAGGCTVLDAVEELECRAEGWEDGAAHAVGNDDVGRALARGFSVQSVPVCKCGLDKRVE
jgi:hypothetical protein